MLSPGPVMAGMCPRVFCIRIWSPIISITSVATSGPGVAAAARGHTRPPTASVPGLSKLAPALFVFLFPVTELVYPDPVHSHPGNTALAEFKSYETSLRRDQRHVQQF